MPLSKVKKTLKLWFTPPKHLPIRVRCENALAEKAAISYDSDSVIASLQKRHNHSEFNGKVESMEAGIELQSCEKTGAEKTRNLELLEEESPLDIFIEKAVRFTGSIYMFFFMWLLLAAWVAWGASTGAPDHWQIVMQDGQSIQTYVWDTFLMRQQLDDTKSFLRAYGKLKSRSLTHKRLLKQILKKDRHRLINLNDDLENINYKSLTWFDKLSNLMSDLLGSLPAVIIYWAGIFIWIGFGSKPLDIGDGVYKKWSDKWQMFINTATAVELLITSVFLENIRTRNNDFMRSQLEIFADFDSKLELMGRAILEDDDEENPLVEVEYCPRPGMKKYISIYSDVIGTGIGLVISVCVFAAWLSIGSVMHWNDNWWLIIGTYTGLIGFIDGFVLREVFFSITKYEESKFEELLLDSQELLDLAGIQTDLVLPKVKQSFINRISLKINAFCSTDWSVVFSVGLVIILIVIASALHWSTTGQLLANTPTMIIEGFFLLILTQAHNWADDSRSEILVELTKSRRLLHNYIAAYVPIGEGKR